MNTSTAAINEAIDIAVSRFTFRAGRGPRTDGQKRIIYGSIVGRGRQGFEARGTLAPMREEEPFAVRDAPKNRLRVLTKFEHRNRFHAASSLSSS